ncbi:MAG: hypothetical protein ACRD21_22395 [Vicinamibacteria bacterium]
MMDLDRRYGPLSGRVWGLVLNFIGNAVGLYGLSGFLRDGSGLGLLVTGATLTVACVLVLAKPAR